MFSLRISYWWECEACRRLIDFNSACRSKGIAHFIWDVLFPSSWDQTKLTLPCLSCAGAICRIAYQFPRADYEILCVLHIVGIEPDDGYLPMMWETYPVNYPDQRWFDFKYLNRRNITGLTKPAVFSQKGLRAVFDLYCQKVGLKTFP